MKDRCESCNQRPAGVRLEVGEPFDLCVECVHPEHRTAIIPRPSARKAVAALLAFYADAGLAPPVLAGGRA